MDALVPAYPAISRNWNASPLSGGPVIVVEQAAEAASALDRSAPVGETGIREDEQIANALMISLTVIMREEFPNRCAKRAFSEQNHPFQATLLYSADEAFGVAVQIRRPGRQFHRFGAALGQSRQEFHCKEWIAIVNQIALALEQPVYGVGQMAGDLTHPHPVGSGRDPGNLDTSGGQFEKEQNQEALQPLSGPDLNGKEVCCNNLVPMFRRIRSRRGRWMALLLPKGKKRTA